MLVRLKEETHVHHADADADRLHPLASATSVAAYLHFLARVHGFESPLETALAITPGLRPLIDLDGLHPTSAGYQLIADTVFASIKQVIEMPPRCVL